MYAFLFFAFITASLGILIVYVGGKHRPGMISPKGAMREISKTIEFKVNKKPTKITDSGLRNKIYKAKLRRYRYVMHNGEIYETGYTGKDARE